MKTTPRTSDAELKGLRSALRRKEQELAFFSEMGRALVSTLEFDRMIPLMLGKAQRMLHAQGWALMRVDEEARDLYFECAHGKKSEEIKDFRFKMGEGIAGKTAETGRPALIHDVSEDPRFQKGVDCVTRMRFHSILSLPIVSKKKVIGVLEWINKGPGNGNFLKKDLDLASMWMDYIAIALEQATLYRVMANLAVTDDLTKLFNFRYLDQALEAEIRRCRRYHSTVSVVFLDLDRFKLVNDNHGHLMGSKTLVEVAHILVENLRDVDIIARYGGDEFVVVLPYTEAKMAHKITLRLQKAIQKNRFLSDEGLALQVTASFGVAGFPEHADDKTDLIRLADQAMYEAKNQGRDRIVMAEAALTATCSPTR